MDSTLLVWLNDWSHPALSAVMGVVTWLGSLVVLLPLALAVGWRADSGAHLRHRLLLPSVVLGAAAIAHCLKWAIDRERPDLFPSLVTMPSDASFPSAHALQVTAFVAAWLAVTGGWGHFRQLAAGAMLVAAVGFSRLYLQVHYPSDVLAGILFGLLWGWLILRLPFWRRM